VGNFFDTERVSSDMMKGIMNIPSTSRVYGLLSLVCFSFALISCTTLENRRDLYFPQTVLGPYTRMLKHGAPKEKIPTDNNQKEHSSAGKTVIPAQS